MYSPESIISVYYRKLAMRALYAAFIALSVLSCRKEARDTTPPLIVFSSPNAGEIFYYQNTIPISAVVSDETRLESISVEITTTYNGRVYPPHVYSPAGKEERIELSISHDNLYLPSGTYHIKITATDGHNENYAFQEIQLVEAPRELERIFIVRTNANASAIDSLNGAVLMPWLNYSGNCVFGGIDSRNNQLVMSSSSASELSSLAYPDLTPLVAPLPSSQYPLTAFFHDEQFHQFIWGNSSGQIMTTDLTGSRLFSLVNASASIKHITSTDSHIIAISESTTSTGSFIDVYPRSLGLQSLALQVDWDINGAIPLQSDQHFIILAGNRNGQAHFAYLNLNTGAVNENFSFYDSSPLSGIIAADGDDFYAIQSSGVVWYTNNFANYSLNNSIHPSKLVYDDLHHVLWTVDASAIRLFDESLTAESANIPITGATDLWFKYNK